MQRLLFVLIILFVSVRGAAQDRPGLLEQLAAHRPLGSVTLSADGKYVAGLVRQGDGQALAVWSPLEGLSEGAFTGLDRKAIRWMAWVGASRLLIHREDETLAVFDAGTRLVKTLDLAGDGEIRDLELVAPLPDDNDAALLQWSTRPGTRYPAVYRVRMDTGQSREVVKAREPVLTWWSSERGKILMGSGYRSRRQLIFTPQGRREAETGQYSTWRLADERDVFKDAALKVLAVEESRKAAIVLSSHAGDRRSVWRYDLEKQTFSDFLAADVKVDLEGAILDPGTGDFVGAFTSVAGTRQFFQNDVWTTYETVIRDVTGEGGVRFLGGSADGRWLVARTTPDFTYPRYYLLNRMTMETVPLGGGTGRINGYRLDRQNVWIDRSGAGRTRKRDMPRRPMHAVLSVPQGGSDGKALVLVHGGPVRHVRTQFSPLVTWLVANGYTVLEPNFIGSAGFGDAWRRAGYGQWGKRMQRDIRTAGRWLLDQGYAEPGRACVAGGSYGGYTAMMASMSDADVYACAASLNGVTSVLQLVEYLSTFRLRMLAVPRIRMDNSDAALRKVSPLHRVKKIELPLLLVHATRDENVPFIQGELMAGMLERYEKPHTFIPLDGAGHVLREAGHRKTYYRALVDFLDRHTETTAE